MYIYNYCIEKYYEIILKRDEIINVSKLEIPLETDSTIKIEVSTNAYIIFLDGDFIGNLPKDNLPIKLLDSIQTNYEQQIANKQISKLENIIKFYQKIDND